MGEVETLRVSPGHMAGMAQLVSEICTEIRRSTDLIASEAAPSDDFDGVMLMLIDPLNALQKSTEDRYHDREMDLNSTSIELRKAAWLYADTDAKNADLLNQHTHEMVCTPYDDASTTYAPGGIDDYTEIVPFPSPEAADLTPPERETASVAELARDTAEWLADIDANIEEATGTSILNSIVLPVSGNWKALNRIGKVYGMSATAVESTVDSLKSSTSTLDAEWDGQAAINFADYSGRMQKGLQWEGPAGRIIETAMSEIADGLEAAVKTLLEQIIEALEEQVSVEGVTGKLRFLLRKFPAVAAVELANRVRILVSEAWKLFNAVQDGIDAAKEFIEFASDPIDYVKEYGESALNEKLQPALDNIAAAEESVQLARDAADVVRVDYVENAPTEGYSLGEGSAPWEDAK